MRIGINAALNSTKEGYRQTGISRYISEVISGLERVRASSDEVVLLGQHTGPIKENPLTRILWEQSFLPVNIAAQRLSVMHTPIGAVPLLGIAPNVVTVHDLAFLKYPESLPSDRRTWLIAATKMSTRRARKIITVSQATADDLREWLDVPEGKIHAIPLATSGKVERVEGTSLNVFRMKWKIDRPYVVAVGTLEPRKNLPTLLRAFAHIKDQIDHQLVLVGPEGWLTGELKSTLEELDLGDRVRLTGWVSDEELGGWYSGADLFAFPSLYEGFGLPSVEAMRCGAPVLCSDNSAFPEVVGDAGVLLPAENVDAWAETMLSLLNDESRRRELRERGFARAELFSWERTAQETYDVYKEIAR
ncbi:MAG: glycosyltransferase family 4 protein [Thermomicrobiales bacterium]|nr:glycosyltransferase family 4 protein [Thermomicrobiales bacterium]